MSKQERVPVAIPVFVTEGHLHCQSSFCQKQSAFAVSMGSHDYC